MKKSSSLNEINYAVPISRDQEGLWAASFKDADPISPFHELNIQPHAGFKRFKTIHFEPVQVLRNCVPIKNQQCYINKKFLTILVENLKPFFRYDRYHKR